MSYLILQIILFLIAAAALGVAFGWVMARRDLDARIDEERATRKAAIEDWKSRHQETLDLAEAARTRIATLESELDLLRAELYAVTGRPILPERRAPDTSSAELERLRSELAVAREQIANLRAAAVPEAPPAETQPPPQAPLFDSVAEAPPEPAPPPAKDDLKRIKGVNAKLERTLNGMGVFTYRQIATWTEEEAAAVQAQLEGLPNRIRRDNWIGNARIEHKRKYGEEL